VNTIDRPSPKRCTAISARAAPPGPPVTASTVAPGFAGPSGEIAASAGTAAQRLSFSTGLAPSCITG